MSDPVPTLVTYTPKPGGEAELQRLVELHWPTLNRLGLSTAEPARLWRSKNVRTGKVAFVELFSWKDGDCSRLAHQTPEVMALWEPMGAVLEELTIAEVEAIG